MQRGRIVSIAEMLKVPEKILPPFCFSVGISLSCYCSATCLTCQGVGVSETNTDYSSWIPAVERYVQHVGGFNLSEGNDYQKAETTDDGNELT